MNRVLKITWNKVYAFIILINVVYIIFFLAFMYYFKS
jgi:hypothetical protein